MSKPQRAKGHTSQAIKSILKQISSEEQERIDNKMLLAAKIDDAIKARKWTQSDFAREMGKQPSEVSKWLSGTHNFTADTLWDISAKLGIELISIKEQRMKITKVVEYRIKVSGPAIPQYTGSHQPAYRPPVSHSKNKVYA